MDGVKHALTLRLSTRFLLSPWNHRRRIAARKDFNLQKRTLRRSAPPHRRVLRRKERLD